MHTPTDSVGVIEKGELAVNKYTQKKIYYFVQMLMFVTILNGVCLNWIMILSTEHKCLT